MHAHHPARRHLLRLAAAGAGGLLLGACGGADKAESESGTSAPVSLNSDTPGDTPSDGVGTATQRAPAGFAWRITVDQVLALPAGTSALIATGAQGMTATAFPELPEGRLLSITGGGDLIMVASAGAPVVDARGPWEIKVSSAD